MESRCSVVQVSHGPQVSALYPSAFLQIYLSQPSTMDTASLVARIDQLLRTGPPPNAKVLEKCCAVLEKARGGGGGSSRHRADEDDDLRSIDGDSLQSSVRSTSVTERSSVRAEM